MEMEQSAYNELKPTWGRIPETMQSHCTMVAKASGAGSYMILQSCIEQELEAKKTNAGTSFNY
ncbi:hypothetical protein SAMN05216272_111105 [Pseudomonas panipatensis]|uniref:Uncharacterized protein n=2 Tax=Pseudomonas panipatensis TaxID=428992 RepID=A0A1G8LE91_9PSED|nr:hypothetical protein SAMN05216272_111105 [Pseudomonas panipatensis]SMP75059.1 hypothetical protein SAMN06295951_11395 [Pseudomonas panipatensis]